MLEVVDRAIQVHGALGITDDTVLADYYAHERGARIYDGPDEVHKMVVAKRILEPLRRRERRTLDSTARSRCARARSWTSGGSRRTCERSSAWRRAAVDGRAISRRPLEPDLPGHRRRRSRVRAAPAAVRIKVKSAHDMGRECRDPVEARAGLSAGAAARRVLRGRGDPRRAVLLMERVAGVILRKELPAGLALDPQTLRTPVRVARRRPGRAARGRLRGGRPRRLRQARGLRRAPGHAAGPKRYATRRPTRSPTMRASASGWPSICRRRARRRSSTTTTSSTTWCSTRTTSTRIIGVLDWEMATLGDPLMDLGTALCYWVEAGDSDEMQDDPLRPHDAAGDG